MARAPKVVSCSYPPCDRVAVVKGLCRAHYQQQWTGKPLTPIGQRRAVSAGTLDGLADKVAAAVIAQLRAEGVLPPISTVGND